MVEKICSTCRFEKEVNAPCYVKDAPECGPPFYKMWEPITNPDSFDREMVYPLTHTGNNKLGVIFNENGQGYNNGGSTDNYNFPENMKCVQDLIEYRNMNFSQGNICKVACTFNTQRHNGTTYERELNKIIWFAQRELKRIKENL